jgi:hypothetical protein
MHAGGYTVPKAQADRVLAPAGYIYPVTCRADIYVEGELVASERSMTVVRGRNGPSRTQHVLRGLANLPAVGKHASVRLQHLCRAHSGHLVVHLGSSTKALLACCHCEAAEATSASLVPGAETETGQSGASETVDIAAEIISAHHPSGPSAFNIGKQHTDDVHPARSQPGSASSAPGSADAMGEMLALLADIAEEDATQQQAVMPQPLLGLPIPQRSILSPVAAWPVKTPASNTSLSPTPAAGTSCEQDHSRNNLLQPGIAPQQQHHACEQQAHQQFGIKPPGIKMQANGAYCLVRSALDALMASLRSYIGTWEADVYLDSILLQSDHDVEIEKTPWARDTFYLKGLAELPEVGRHSTAVLQDLRWGSEGQLEVLLVGSSTVAEPAEGDDVAGQPQAAAGALQAAGAGLRRASSAAQLQASIKKAPALQHVAAVGTGAEAEAATAAAAAAGDVRRSKRKQGLLLGVLADAAASMHSGNEQALAAAPGQHIMMHASALSSDAVSAAAEGSADQDAGSMCCLVPPAVLHAMLPPAYMIFPLMCMADVYLDGRLACTRASVSINGSSSGRLYWLQGLAMVPGIHDESVQLQQLMWGPEGQLLVPLVQHTGHEHMQGAPPAEVQEAGCCEPGGGPGDEMLQMLAQAAAGFC